MQAAHQLGKILQRIDGRGYKAYKQIAGGYDFGDFFLFIDHVQGDPFASPSLLRIRVPQRLARFPESLFSNRIRRIALQDYLIRRVYGAIQQVTKGTRGTGKSGLMFIDVGGQEVIERTAMVVNADWVEARIEMGLPAAGRTILGKQAHQMIFEELPSIVNKSLMYNSLDSEAVEQFVNCIENQEYLRSQLRERNLVAFVANGSILPRESGFSDRPLPAHQAVAFQAPDSLTVSLKLLHPIPGKNGRLENEVVGMGIPAGVTLIVGGGYHGKSTLLRALEMAVYPHIPGDGREYVVTIPEAVKIRAEDGRRVENVNINPFITNLPMGVSTEHFSTENASGSTSQAANIMENLEVGARLLLVDEDTSASNFMVRDARMQALVAKEFEPITPFVDRVRELYTDRGISTILIMGGSGDYLDVADRVILMRNYLPEEVTAQAREVVQKLPTQRKIEAPGPFPSQLKRIPLPDSIDSHRGRKEIKIDARAIDELVFGRFQVDLRHVEQIVHISQTRAIGYALQFAKEHFMNGRVSLSEILDKLENLFDSQGLDVLNPFYQREKHPGRFARPRRFEIAAALNRLPSLRVQQGE